MDQEVSKLGREEDAITGTDLKQTSKVNQPYKVWAC